MDSRPLTRRLTSRADTFCPRPRRCKHAVDHPRRCDCEIIYRLYRDARQRAARVSISHFGQDRAGIHIPCVLLLFKRAARNNTVAESGLKALNAGMPEGSSSPLTHRVIYDRLHLMLQHLLSLIPTLPSTLQPLLVRNFPHKRQSQLAQITYIRNLLRVSVYCPELADKILATIVDRAIQIDVRDPPTVYHES